MGNKRLTCQATETPYKNPERGPLPTQRPCALQCTTRTNGCHSPDLLSRPYPCPLPSTPVVPRVVPSSLPPLNRSPSPYSGILKAAALPPNTARLSISIG